MEKGIDQSYEAMRDMCKALTVIGIFIFLCALSGICAFSTYSFPANFPLTRAVQPLPALKSANPPKSAPAANEDEWVTMPAGGKPAYMGIHGGTMPVSLLVSGDGSSLFTFVGRTGNDFLNVLRDSFMPLPSIGNSTRMGSAPVKDLKTGLFAGNATASMPVIALSGDRLANQSWFGQLAPFGLSAEPLSIEGEVMKPEGLSPARKYRIYFLPDYFQPRRNGAK